MIYHLQINRLELLERKLNCMLLEQKNEWTIFKCLLVLDKVFNNRVHGISEEQVDTGDICEICEI